MSKPKSKENKKCYCGKEPKKFVKSFIEWKDGSITESRMCFSCFYNQLIIDKDIEVIKGNK